MPKGISVGIASDTREFAKAVKSGMVDPLTNAQAELDDLGRHGTDAGTVLERTLTKQQTDTEKLRADIGHLNDDIRTKSRQAYQQLGEDAHAGTQKAEEGINELKDSARQNAIETAASFNGSFDSIAGGVQGLASEALAGLGPAGATAGLVAAAGIGLVTTAVDATTQQVQVDQAAVGTLTQQYLDAGTTGRRAFTDVAAALEDMATNASGSAIITLQTAYDEAARAGGDYRDVVKSIASADPEQISAALRRVQSLKDQQAVMGSLNDLTVKSNGLDSSAALGHLTNQAAVIDLESALKKAKEQAVESGRAQQLAAQAGLSDLQQKTDLIGQLHSGYSDTASAASDYLDKESGLFDVSKYISAMHKRADALENYKDDLLKANLTPEAKAFLDAQGADSASLMVAGYKKASPSQKAELDRIWTAAGRSNASSYGQALGDDLKGIKLTAPPPQLADLTTDQVVAWQRKAQAYLDAHPVSGSVKVVARTPYGKPIYQ